MANRPLIFLLLMDDAGDGIIQTVTEIPLDVRKQSTYQFQAEITENPIDDGSEIADHRIKKPPVITLEGFVSDAPLVTLTKNSLGLKGDSSSYSDVAPTCKNAYDVLRYVDKNDKVLTVVTEYETFENMCLEDLQFPRNPEQGSGLYFSVTIKHISIVQSKTAALSQDVVKRFKKKTSPKATKHLTAAQKKMRDRETKKIIDGGKTTQAELDAKVKAAGKTKASSFKNAGTFKRS